jgi:hypothetical protein
LLFWDKNIIFWSHLFCKVYRDVRGPSYASWHPQLGFLDYAFWDKNIVFYSKVSFFVRVGHDVRGPSYASYPSWVSGLCFFWIKI